MIDITTCDIGTLNIDKLERATDGTLIIKEWAIPHVDKNGYVCGEPRFRLAITLGVFGIKGWQMILRRTPTRDFYPVNGDVDDWERMLELAADDKRKNALTGYQFIISALDEVDDILPREASDAFREYADAALKSLEICGEI